MTSSRPARAALPALALLAALVLGSAPALARQHALTLRTASGALAAGASLATPGGTLAIDSVKGDVRCPASELRAVLESNGLASDAFGSSVETGGYRCTSEWPTGFGESAEVQVMGRQEDQIAAKGKGTIAPQRAHEAVIHIDVNFRSDPSCEYTATRIPFKFSAGAPGDPQPVVMAAKMGLKAVRGQPKGCPMMTTLVATLPLQAEGPPALSGEYEAVESEAS